MTATGIGPVIRISERKLTEWMRARRASDRPIGFASIWGLTINGNGWVERNVIMVDGTIEWKMSKRKKGKMEHINEPCVMVYCLKTMCFEFMHILCC